MNAVLVIDMQPEWVTSVCKNFPDLEENIRSSLKLYREKGIEIIHIRANYTGKKWLKEFSRLNPNLPTDISIESVACAEECDMERVFIKQYWGAFFGTNLEDYLNEKNITDIHLMGILTSICVQHTAYEAFSRGYRVFVLEKCTGDRSIERHKAALSLYGGYMYTVI